MQKYVDQYRYVVVWSEDDKEFVGRCTEFPSLSHLDKSQEAAFKGIKDLVTAVVEDMLENKEAIPEPIYSKKYSGKTVLRMSEEQHRELAVAAAENNVSLNSYIISHLKGPRT